MNRKRRRRRLILFIIELAVLAILIVVLFYYQKINQIEVVEVDESKIAVNDIEEETLIEMREGYETIAIFGLDNRNVGHTDYGNSDVIMVLNIDNDTQDISMISVYRDSYLNIAAAGETANFQKANAAYANGGASQAINMLNQNLDLDIDHYVTVDFQAVAEAIDILGGVEIEIESTYEMDYLNDYITATNKILGTDSPLVTSLGVQTLDGTQAVAYTRIRYTSGGDYKRALRQRIVLSAMFDEIKEANFTQITALIDQVFPDISTDMTQRDLLSMAQAFLGYDLGNSQGFPFFRAGTRDETYGDVVVPCDLESNVIYLHEFLFGDEEYEPSPQVLAYSDYIVEKTGKTADDYYDDQFLYADDYEEEEEPELSEEEILDD